MKIQVDTREQKSFALCDSWKDVEYEVVTLKTADYTNGNITIERKGISDFINCCGKDKKRFIKECERGYDYLLIEQSLPAAKKHLRRVRSKMSANYIFHMMKEVRRKYGIEVIMSNDRDHSAELALFLLSSNL